MDIIEKGWNYFINSYFLRNFTAFLFDISCITLLGYCIYFTVFTPIKEYNWGLLVCCIILALLLKNFSIRLRITNVCPLCHENRGIEITRKMNKKLILLITICINLIVFAFLFVTHKSSNKLNIVLTDETIATKEDEPVFFDIAKKEEFGNIRKGEFYENVKQKDLQNRNIRYKITTFSADCSEIKLQKLTYPIIQYFNDKNELVETDNPYEYWKRNYPDGHLGVTHASDIENGELYFNILCYNEQFKFNASQELQNAYSKAIKFCLKDKISEQNGTGGFYICKGNYIRNNSPSIETEWDSIFKTCFYNNPISNIDKCLDKIVVK